VKIRKEFKKENLGARLIEEIEEVLLAVRQKYPNIVKVILFDCDWGFRVYKPNEVIHICVISDDFTDDLLPFGPEKTMTSYCRVITKLDNIMCELEEDRGKFSIKICVHGMTVKHYTEGDTRYIENNVKSGFTYWEAK
jgi:hypothetical protein